MKTLRQFSLYNETKNPKALLASSTEAPGNGTSIIYSHYQSEQVYVATTEEKNKHLH